jgi:DNA-directed RNA polymerase specialized sigma24 family protein
MSDTNWLAAQFEEHRGRLVAIAQRMLGSAGEADDAVQVCAVVARDKRRAIPGWPVSFAWHDLDHAVTDQEQIRVIGSAPLV